MKFGEGMKGTVVIRTAGHQDTLLLPGIVLLQLRGITVCNVCFLICVTVFMLSFGLEIW